MQVAIVIIKKKHSGPLTAAQETRDTGVVYQQLHAQSSVSCASGAVTAAQETREYQQLHVRLRCQ